MDPRAHRGEVLPAMKSWAEGLRAGERLLPGMAVILLDRAVELEGEPIALQVAHGLAEIAELDLTVKALRLLGEHDLRPWAVEVAVRVLVGEPHLPFMSPIALTRVVEAAEGGQVDPDAVSRLRAVFLKKIGVPGCQARGIDFACGSGRMNWLTLLITRN